LFIYNLAKQRYVVKSKGEKEKLLYYVIGFSTLNFIGFFGFLPAYKISIYPFFLIAPLTFSLIISYAIVYIGLLNIKLTIRRYSVYLFSLLTLLAPAYIIMYFSYHNFPRFLLLIFVFTFLVALFIFPKIKNHYYLLSNKYLFSSLYDFNDLIYSLNNSLHATLDVNKMFRRVIEILSQAFNSKKIIIFYYDDKTKKWFEISKNTFNKFTLRLNNDSSVKEIVGNQNFVLVKDLKNRKIKRSTFLRYLLESKIDLILPIKHRTNKIQALVLFGRKISGESYNNKDKRVLSLTASEISVALENISLYENVKKFNYKLKEEIKRATIKLAKQNKELKELDKIKDEFLSIASHQLRTPLTSIRWFTEILISKKQKNKRKNKDELGLLAQINDSNLKMIKLVNDLLDVSHIETGRKFQIVKKKFNINEIIDEVINENSYLINQKKLTILNVIPKEEQVYADKGKLKQVLQNLISNACKYCFENSTINIYVKLIQDKKHFCVKDQGIGIPKNQQNRLFVKFFRANNAAKQYVEGTGLGLYIARELIRAHQGELYFKSSVNKGSTFYFYLN
jgi:signal transduction histidine kinase